MSDQEASIWEEPLSPAQREEMVKVKNSYGDFWKNIKFRNGWDAPLFEQEEVDHLLDQAAEIVVRVRTYLDTADPTFKIRATGGASHEYFWELDWHPLEKQAEFVRGLVHATLRDANGYVENLSAKFVNRVVDIVLASKSSVREAPSIVQTWDDRDQVLAAWDGLSASFLSFFDGRMLDSVGRETPAKLLHLRKLAGHIDIARRHVLALQAICRHDDSSDVSEASMDVDPPVAVAATEEEAAAAEAAAEDEKEAGAEDGAGTDAMEGCEAEQDTPLQQSQSSIKVHTVAEKVEELRPSIRDLCDNAATLDKMSIGSPELATQVKTMGKKCSEFSELLMQNLLKLDAIVEASEESKALRRAQVKAINALLDSVDSVQEKIKALKKEMNTEEERRKQEEQALAQKKKEEEEEQERKEEGEEQQGDDAMEDSAGPSAHRDESLSRSIDNMRKDIEHHSLRDQWAKMKFEPRFDVKQFPEKYVISAYLPGMSERDINVRVGDDGESIVLEGLRVPSDKEEAQMRQHLRSRYRYNAEEEDVLLLKIGAGRFGRFVERYRLPANADVDNIRAFYERGVMQVDIPIKQRALRRHVPQQPQQRVSQNPYSGFPGFFNDRDLWW